MKTKRKLYVLLGLIVVVGIFAYNYIYKDHRDIATEEASYVVAAQEIAQEFLDNEEMATQKYLNKTIVVEGKLTSMDAQTLVLDALVFFALSDNQELPAGTTNQSILKIKGRCLGYDSLLNEVKFDQASVQTD